MAKEIHIITILKWLAMAFVILILAWVAFSHSPTLEQIFSLSMTYIFLYLALEGRDEMSEIKGKLEKLNTLDEIRDILKERLK